MFVVLSRTKADPNLLAKYVAALLKNNKPKKELETLCVDKLFDFLGDGMLGPFYVFVEAQKESLDGRVMLCKQLHMSQCWQEVSFCELLCFQSLCIICVMTVIP